MNKQQISYMSATSFGKTERQGQSYMVMAEIINLIIPLDTVIPITRLHLSPFFFSIKGKSRDLQKTAGRLQSFNEAGRYSRSTDLNIVRASRFFKGLRSWTPHLNLLEWKGRLLWRPSSNFLTMANVTQNTAQSKPDSRVASVFCVRVRDNNSPFIKEKLESQPMTIFLCIVTQSRRLLNNGDQLIFNVFSPNSHAFVPLHRSDENKMWLGASRPPSRSRACAPFNLLVAFLRTCALLLGDRPIPPTSLNG